MWSQCFQPGVVAFEGLPGVGKSTLIQSLVQRLGVLYTPEVLVPDHELEQPARVPWVQRNDRLKSEAASSRRGTAIALDRYYMSTWVLDMLFERDAVDVSCYARPEAWVILDTDLGELERRWKTRGRPPSSIWLACGALSLIQDIYRKIVARGEFYERPVIAVDAGACPAQVRACVRNKLATRGIWTATVVPSLDGAYG